VGQKLLDSVIPAFINEKTRQPLSSATSIAGRNGTVQISGATPLAHLPREWHRAPDSGQYRSDLTNGPKVWSPVGRVGFFGHHPNGRLN